MNSSLTELTRVIASLAAVGGYRAAVRLIGGPHGGRIALEAWTRATGGAPQYCEEMPLEALALRGALALASGFDRSVREALAVRSEEARVPRAMWH